MKIYHTGIILKGRKEGQTGTLRNWSYWIVACVVLGMLGFNPVQLAKHFARKFECDLVRGQITSKTETCIREGWYSEEPSSW